jgi:hypothetical protein
MSHPTFVPHKRQVCSRVMWAWMFLSWPLQFRLPELLRRQHYRSGQVRAHHAQGVGEGPAGGLKVSVIGAGQGCKCPCGMEAETISCGCAQCKLSV